MQRHRAVVGHRPRGDQAGALRETAVQGETHRNQKTGKGLEVFVASMAVSVSF